MALFKNQIKLYLLEFVIIIYVQLVYLCMFQVRLKVLKRPAKIKATYRIVTHLA